MEVPRESPRPRTFAGLLKPLLISSLVDLALLLIVLVGHAVTNNPSLLTLALLLTLGGGLLGASCIVVGTIWGIFRFPSHRWTIVFVILLTGGVLLAHGYVINSPPTQDCTVTDPTSNGCIMDEGVYYVPAAHLILNGTQCGLQNTTEVPSACNLEHPFLGKAFVAAGMAIFGDNDVGYRFFEVILGTFSLPLLFLLALKVSGSRKLSAFATLLLSFDVMFFAHSSAGLIDVQQVFFILLALVTYAYDLHFWRVDKHVVSGALLGLAGLTKETAVFGVLAVATYVLIFGDGNLKHRSLSTMKMGVTLGGVFILGLQLYDSLFASGTFPTFLGHLSFMVQYGSTLTGPLLCSPDNAASSLATGSYWCKFPGDPRIATPILPVDWLGYYAPVQYYVDRICVIATTSAGSCLGPSYIRVGYYGITNLLVTWTVFAWIPLAGLTFYRLFRPAQAGPNTPSSGDTPSLEPAGETRLMGLAAIWFLWNYVPYYWVQYVLGRVTYPYYFVPAIPSLALGAAYLISRRWFPNRLALGYLVVAFCFFFVFFPDKSFLPINLRELIGR